MNLFNVLLIGIGLAMDAAAVSLCKGLAVGKAKWHHCAIAGAYFGIFQGAMPAIGYALGCSFAEYINAFDHWVAFVLLAFIGGNMLKEALSKEEEQILLGICSYMRGRHIFVVYVTNYTISCICIYFYLLFDNFLHMFKCTDMDLLNVLYGIVHAFAYLLPSDWCIVTFRMLG